MNRIANYICGIGDEVLRDVNVRGKYRHVILPMPALRRLDVVLEPTTPAALDMKATLDSCLCFRGERPREAGRHSYPVALASDGRRRDGSQPFVIRNEVHAWSAHGPTGGRAEHGADTYGGVS